MVNKSGALKVDFEDSVRGTALTTQESRNGANRWIPKDKMLSIR